MMIEAVVMAISSIDDGCGGNGNHKSMIKAAAAVAITITTHDDGSSGDGINIFG